MGVGAFDVASGPLYTIYGSQSHGPTDDNRIKPDFQAPTDTYTASSFSNMHRHKFGGTSAATAYAGGASRLVRNTLRCNTPLLDPGQTYAFLIMAGQRPNFDNAHGAGPLLLPGPSGGMYWTGKIEIGHGGWKTILLPITGSYTRVDAAIWWPEDSSAAHSDIDLYLTQGVGSDLVVKDHSIDGPSIFERVQETGTITGTRRIHFYGYNVPSAPQTVYYAAYAHSP